MRESEMRQFEVQSRLLTLFVFTLQSKHVATCLQWNASINARIFIVEIELQISGLHLQRNIRMHVAIKLPSIYLRRVAARFCHMHFAQFVAL
jgi:hypothetical protein